MSITITTSVARVTPGATPTGTGTTASFTPAVGEMLVVCATFDNTASTAVTVSDSQSGSWTTVRHDGTAAPTANVITTISYRLITTSASMTVTVACSGAFFQSFKVYRLSATGALTVGATGNGGLAATSGNPTAYTSTVANSLMVVSAGTLLSTVIASSSDLVEDAFLNTSLDDLTGFGGTRDNGSVGSEAFNLSNTGGNVWHWAAIEVIESVQLVVADASQPQTVDNVTLTQHHVLTVADASQAQTADNVALVQHHVLVVADASQAQTADNVALTQHHVLDPLDAQQSQTADNVALTQHHVLTLADASQAQTADGVVLTQHHVLTVADASQSMTSDVPALTQHHVLVVGDASQAQTADNVLLALSGVLQVADATQSMTSDAPTLIQHHVLTVADAAQSETVDNAALIQHHVLAVQVASQPQTADNVALTQHHVLTVADASQSQTADAVALTQHHVLTVADASQSQSAGIVVLTLSASADSDTGTGWDGLLAIFRDQREDARRAEIDRLHPVACPNDGEPLQVGPDGRLFCIFDGWRP